MRRAPRYSGAVAVTATAALCVTADGVFGQARRDGGGVDTVSGARLGDLAGQLAVARISASFPSHWAAPRCNRLAAELAAGGACVELTPIAVAAASFVAFPPLHRPRLVVVELERHATTVSCVMPSGEDVRIVACEREPRVGLDEMLDTARSADAIATLAGLVERVCADRAVEEIVIVAEGDPAALEPLLVGLAKASPRVGRSRVLHPVQTCPPDERPAASPQRRLGALGRGAAVASAAVSVLGIAVGLGWWQASAQRPAAAAPAEAVSTVGPAQPVELTEVNGRVHFVVPTAWSPRPVDQQRPGRLELVPPGGVAARIIVIQNEIDPDLGYDEVASALAAKIAARGSAGPFADLQRDVVFGGRPGLSYRETPSSGSEVRWHVVVEQELQVSVGCQYPAGDWAAVGTACEKVVRSLAVASGG